MFLMCQVTLSSVWGASQFLSEKYINAISNNNATYGLNFRGCVCALNKHNAGDRVGLKFDDTLPFSPLKLSHLIICFPNMGPE